MVRDARTKIMDASKLGEFPTTDSMHKEIMEALRPGMWQSIYSKVIPPSYVEHILNQLYTEVRNESF